MADVAHLDALHQRRRLDSRHKRDAVQAAAKAALEAGTGLTVAAIARRAGVSRKFVYDHPDLRAEIEEAVARAGRDRMAVEVAQARVTGATLRVEVDNARAQNRRLLDRIRALERRLGELLGAQAAHEMLPEDHAAGPDLRARVEELEQEVFESRERARELEEELEAAREANRQLITQQNRAPR